MILLPPNQNASKTGRRAVRAGMSLIEVLVSMSVFLICLAGIGQLVDTGTARALQTKNQNTATRLAQSKLAEVEAGVLVVSESSTGDFIDDGEENWTWSINSVPLDIPNLYDVTVTVSRTISGKDFQVKLSQTIFDPQHMGNAADASPLPAIPPSDTPAPKTGGSNP